MTTNTNQLFREVLYGKQLTETEKALLAMAEQLAEDNPELFSDDEKREMFEPDIPEDFQVPALGRQVDGRLFTSDVDAILSRFRDVRQGRHDDAVQHYEKVWEEAKSVFKVPSQTFDLVIVFCKAYIECEENNSKERDNFIQGVNLDADFSRDQAIEFKKDMDSRQMEHEQRINEGKLVLYALLGLNTEIYSKPIEDITRLFEQKDEETSNLLNQVSILDEIISLRLQFDKLIKEEDNINVQTRSAMKQAELDLLEKSRKIVSLANSVTADELYYSIVTDPRLIRDGEDDTRTYQELCADMLAGGFLYIFPGKYIDHAGDLTMLDQSALPHIEELPLIIVPLHPGLFRWIEGCNTEDEIRQQLAQAGISECPVDFNRLVDHVFADSNDSNDNNDSNNSANSGTSAAPKE